MSRLPLTAIAAVARNGVIGREGRLPWVLPSDMRHFRSRTMGRPLIVGRRTFDSIGGPLAGRALVVVTRRELPSHEGIVAAADVLSALDRAEAIGRAMKAPDVVVAGGASLYEALLPACETVLITAVDLEPDGDTLFPPLPDRDWVVVERTPLPRTEHDDAESTVIRYGRRVPEPSR